MPKIENLSNRAIVALYVIFVLLFGVLTFSTYMLVHTQQEKHEQELAQLTKKLTGQVDDLRDSVATQAQLQTLSIGLLLPSDTVHIADTTILLGDPYIRSQVQRELGYLLDHRWALVEAWQNLGRYDSLMRWYFARDSVHLSLGRMYVSENYLRARGMSPKGAEGPCGITERTGRDMGLKINRYIDERRAPVRAFDLASRHLKGSYREFHDWLLAAAGYNRGDGGVNDRLYGQKFKGFFNVLLPDETQRYAYRFIALLLIDQLTERFVPGLRQVTQLPPFAVEVRRVNLKRTIYLAELANMVGLKPTTFWFYNIQFRGVPLPPGTYTVYVPKYVEN